MYLGQFDDQYSCEDLLFINISFYFVGETKECTEFAKQFLERRSKQRNQQRLQNAHIDDMCSPAPAITPSINSGINSDFQEVKVRSE